VDQISSADLLNLVLAQRSSIDLQFQFWLTITFAVIVASFIAGPRQSTIADLGSGPGQRRQSLPEAEIALTSAA